MTDRTGRGASGGGGRDVVRLDGLKKALAAIETPGDAKAVGDKAELLRHYARMSRDRDLEISAVEVRVRAERQLGRMLRELKVSGLLRDRRPSEAEKAGGDIVTLDELGLSRKDSMRAQRMAERPERDFERAVAAWREEEARRQARAIGSLFKAVARPMAPLKPRPLPAGRFATIYADPPWRYETWSDAGKDRAPDNHYPTMDTAAICALPVADIAADDCALFLWAYTPMLPDALQVIQFWGFTYKTIAFMWAKSNGDVEDAIIGQGHWTRQQGEICLLATRGRPQRIEKGVRQLVVAPRGEHSEKPEEVAASIERLVGGPYVELFAETTRPGWTAWGNPTRGITR